MFGGKKITCPACGAKNKRDLRRCRVCTAVINTKVAEADRSFMGPEGRAPEPAASADPSAPMDSGSDDGSFGIDLPGGDGIQIPGDGIDIAAPPRNPDDGAPAPDFSAGETFDPSWLERTGPGHGGVPAAQFDDEGFLIDPDTGERYEDNRTGPPASGLSGLVRKMRADQDSWTDPEEEPPSIWRRNDRRSGWRIGGDDDDGWF